jgi:EpsI family protein
MALVLGALVLYHDTVFSFVQLWTIAPDPTYHHGLPVAGICAFLFCRRWAQVSPFMQMRPSASAAVLALLASCTWLLASLVHVLILQQVSLVLLLLLLVVSVVGYRSAWLFAFPMALLLFTVPIWEPLRPYAQRATAHAATFLVSLTGIPVLLEGTEISVPAGAFNVAPSCSGMAYLIVGTMTGALFAYTHGVRRRTVIWILVASVAVSFFANALRISTVVVAGQLTEMQHQFVLEDHSALGWGLFGACILLLLLIASRLIGPASEAQDSARAKASVPAVARGKGVSLARSAMLSLGALVFGPALVYAYQSERSNSGMATLNLPAEIGSWRAVRVPRGGYRPVFQMPDLEHETFYRDPRGREVYLYVAWYGRQEQGKEAVSNANSVSDSKAWQPVLTTARYVDSMADVLEVRLRSRSGEEKLVWQWYYVHGSAVSSRYLAKLLNAWGTLNKDPTAAVVVVATDAHANEENTEALLQSFVADAKHTVEHAIDRALQR